MMAPVSFFVAGTPRPAPRPRFGLGRAYHHSSADVWKSQIFRGYACLRRGPFSGPLHLEIEFLFSAGSVMGAGCWHTSRPDLDNLEKAAMDALNRFAWADDAQVCAITSAKFMAKRGESAGARITIRPLEARA